RPALAKPVELEGSVTEQILPRHRGQGHAYAIGQLGRRDRFRVHFAYRLPELVQFRVVNRFPCRQLITRCDCYFTAHAAFLVSRCTTVASPRRAFVSHTPCLFSIRMLTHRPRILVEYRSTSFCFISSSTPGPLISRVASAGLMTKSVEVTSRE